MNENNENKINSSLYYDLKLLLDFDNKHYLF